MYNHNAIEKGIGRVTDFYVRFLEFLRPLNQNILYLLHVTDNGQYIDSGIRPQEGHSL